MNGSPVITRTLSLLSFFRRGLQRVVLPNDCVFCGMRCRPGEPPICVGCYADLPWIRHACGRCANPVETELACGVHCADCQTRPPPFEAAVAPLSYSFPADAAIKAMKFRRKLHYVPAFVHVLAISMQRLPGDIDALLPVPLHTTRLRERGFNQATELARRVSRELGIPLDHRRCRRTRQTEPQSLLSTNARRINLRNAFMVRGNLPARHVAIIDDVMTTGHTTGELACVLKQAGAEYVEVWVIARAGG